MSSQEVVSRPAEVIEIVDVEVTPVQFFNPLTLIDPIFFKETDAFLQQQQPTLILVSVFPRYVFAEVRPVEERPPSPPPPPPPPPPRKRNKYPRFKRLDDWQEKTSANTCRSTNNKLLLARLLKYNTPRSLDFHRRLLELTTQYVETKTEAWGYAQDLRENHYCAHMQTSGRLTVLRTSYDLCMRKLGDIRLQKRVLQARAGEYLAARHP